MKLLVSILSSLILVQAGVVKKDDDCNGVTINGVYYEKELLKAGLDRPYFLSTDRDTNTVYFSYSLDPINDYFKAAKVQIDSSTFSDIEGVPNGFALFVDQDTHDVYIGGSNGIYKYDPANNKAEYFAANATDIWMLYFKDVVYFSEYPSQFLYTVVDKQIIRFHDLEDTKVDNFIIDNDGVLFFTNYTGLYSQKAGTKEPVYYEDTNNLSVRGLTTDIDGKVYVCVQNGIYAVVKHKHQLEKVVDLDDAFGVSFDKNNNIIYSDATSLNRFVKVDKNCIE